MSDPSDTPQLELARQVLEAYTGEYERLSSRFSELELKAQATAAVGGLFLAASLAAADAGSRPFIALSIMKIVHSLLFLAGIFVSLMAIQVRAVLKPPGGGDLSRLAAALHDAGDPPVSGNGSRVFSGIRRICGRKRPRRSREW